MKHLLYLLVIGTLLFFGCKPSNKMTYENLAYLYKAQRGKPAIQFRPYNVSDSITRVYFKTRLQDYLYSREKPGEPFEARLQVHFELYESFESNEIIDSATLIYTDTRHYGKNYELIEFFKVHANYPGNYIIVIDVKDLNRGQSLTSLHEIWKKSYSDPHYFLPLTPKGNPLFRNYFSTGQPFQIESRVSDKDKLYVSYYEQKFPAAKPPFVEEEEEMKSGLTPDTLFSLMLMKKQTELLTLDKPGFYIFQNDTTQKEGLTLSYFHDGYPVVNTSRQMVEALRYITNREEFEKLSAYKEPKIAVDSFWLNLAGTPGRAMVMLKKYYHRVEEANRLFPSIKEGWKTDRGMLYVVFGMPNAVFRRGGYEQWVYGIPGSLEAQKFDFYIEENPYVRNCLGLERSNDYESVWYNKVEVLRR